MPERCLTFPCQGELLVGILHEPEALARDIGVLIVVGGPQYRVGSHRQFVLIARSFATAGYPVFRFDYRGMGDSAGDPRTFESIDADIRAAMGVFLEAEKTLCGVVIFGLCDAASAALMYCAGDLRVRGLMLANPWVRRESSVARVLVRHYYRTRIFQYSFWQKVLAGNLHLSEAIHGFLVTLRRVWGIDARKELPDPSDFLQRMKHGLERFRGPVALLVSERDLTAREFDDLCRSDPAWAQGLSRSCLERIDLVGADHTFSSKIALNSAVLASLKWLTEHRSSMGGLR